MGIERLWTHEGSVALPAEVEPVEAISRLAEAIRDKQYIPDVLAEGHHLHFSQSIFAIRPNWLALFPYSSGELWVDGAGPDAVVRYRLALWQGLCFGLVICGLIATIGALDSGVTGLRFGFLGFAWLYGGTYVLGAIRAPSFFQDVLTAGTPMAGDLTLAGKIGCFLILALFIGFFAVLFWPALER